MANKTLTATVRLNTSQAERSIQRLTTKINTINNTVNRIGNNNRVNSQLNQSDTRLGSIVSKTRQWNAQLKSTNSSLGSIGSRLKSIASTYLGIMGTKAMIGVSDTITSAQNKLNYVSAQSLGSEGVTADGSGHSAKTLQMTQQAMDKMYVSSNKVRMSYTDMMSNVSKSMALAGKSFDGSIDNAIRFQEIMAEAYAVGGASAQEMSTSMYQMIQALGAGVLAGDELRSVREGAPLAYQAIEEFAQGVYDCEDSLKDMASQGKITSDMVVAAVMNAGDKLDDAFKKTEMTFAQAWVRIKNMATKAFEPVSKMLNKALNDWAKSDGFQKLENAFIKLSKVLQITFKLIINGFNWVIDNWDTVKSYLISIATTLGILFAADKIANFIMWIIYGGKWVIFFAIAIYSLVKPITDLLTGVKTLSQAIEEHLWIVGVGLLVLGAILGNWWVALAGAIVLTLAVIVRFFEQVCGAVWVAITFIGNLVQTLVNKIVTLIWWLVQFIGKILSAIVNFVIEIVNIILGIVFWLGSVAINITTGVINSILQVISNAVEPFISIIEWILNVCNGGFNSFGDAVANLIGQIISWFLSLGKVVTKIIDAIFGTNWTAGLESLKNTVTGWGKNEKAITLEKEILPYEIPRIDNTDAANFGANLIPSIPKYDYSDPLHPLGTGLEDWSITQAFEDGSNWGANVRDKVDGWGDKATDWFGDKFNLDNIMEKLGLDPNGFSFPDPNDLANQLTPYDMPSNDELMDSIGNIDDNTKSMKDSMDLKDEDLEYLRKIAEMEWRNEFTTAEIKVDMTNHNTVNGDRDLDGIVSYLSDVLREEMSSVAYGVHY